ncbi:hypothetical protein AMELA_G00224330 [Ameiurus melas]|uniref:Uncharacterized protein n=1 Tax=Ameiurus melas TaxID=219545 RepID=A0A7J5ZZD6_AMEME|nr:hypothetical protein AMELA_G00224330 [Ameiurus melas]
MGRVVVLLSLCSLVTLVWGNSTSMKSITTIKTTGLPNPQCLHCSFFQLLFALRGFSVSSPVEIHAQLG